MLMVVHYMTLTEVVLLGNYAKKWWIKSHWGSPLKYIVPSRTGTFAVITTMILLQVGPLLVAVSFASTFGYRLPCSVSGSLSYMANQTKVSSFKLENSTNEALATTVEFSYLFGTFSISALLCLVIMNNLTQTMKLFMYPLLIKDMRVTS